MKSEEPEPPPLYFRQVLADELQQVRHARHLRWTGEPAAAPEPPPPTPDEVYREAHAARLVGLAFSGGGIRSATFNLGVLQALSELGLVKIFDYLSTVSGGGYIGSWWSAALKRAAGAFGELDQALNPPPREVRGPREDGRIRFLRSYSNYLTPRLGILSQDTWAVIAIYLRNFLLNLAILVAALSALLLVPRLALWLFRFVHDPLVLAGGALATSIVALLAIWRNLQDLPLAPGKGFSAYQQPGWIFAGIILPALGSALFTAGFIWVVLDLPQVAASPWFHAWWLWPVASAATYTVCSLPAALIFFRQSRRPGLTFLVAPLVAGAFGGAMLHFLLYSLTRLHGPLAGPADPTKLEGPAALPLVLAFAPPLLLLGYILAGMLHLGIEGRGMCDERREWLSRLGGRLLQIALLWSAIFLIAFWSPVLATQVRAWGQIALTSGWLASTLAGILVGRGGRTDGRQPNRLLDLIARLAPPIFIAGLLVLLSVALDGVLWSAAGPPLEPIPGWFTGVLGQARAVNLGIDDPAPMLLTLAITVAVALLLSWRIDVNEFSMHLFYRNRLIRCYLGASNPGRRPNPFTGFDPDDDLPLASLAPAAGYAGPLPIVNAAINLVHGEELAWQERKAASFTLTPLHCGYDLARVDTDRKDEAGEGSYRPTARYAYPHGVSLGTAFAISGAAASPNMGYHSSPALSFLMTVFNVRLGWWLGNPAHEGSWRRSGPPVGLFYLFSELLGLTNARSSYVYLSDGGHFENLGVYELVKRRCRLIVAIDAGQDGEVTFFDLGNAIRKCRNDLGVDLEIDTSSMKPGAAGLATWHCAVGRIRYDRIDPGAAAGVLVYVKPSLTGDEPTDLLNYRSLHPEFPHQTTGDQFFDESQFESYRKLGYHLGRSVFEDVATASRRESWIAVEPFVESLIAELKERWFPPSAAVAQNFSRHAAALDQLYERLRQDERLRFLDDQIYPEWRSLLAAGAKRGELPPRLLWLPADPEAIRQGFYFSLALLERMETVYLDLELDTQAEHPDNRGFLNLFKHWSWSGMVRVTWAIAAATFGLRFQRFCERRLGLDLGHVNAVRLSGWSPDELEAAGLNVLEKRLIEEFPATSGQAFDGLVVFELAVAKPATVGDDFRFPFGFALLVGDRLLYLRVQDHLRTMGLARQALKALIEELGIDDYVDPDTWFAGYQTRAAEALRTADADRARRLFLSQRLQTRGYGRSVPAPPPEPAAIAPAAEAP